MMQKRPVTLPRPDRKRCIPAHFSWVDHRLVRDNHLQRCHTSALALYLFLITVADKDGLSYYRGRTICAMLRWERYQLESARRELVAHDLLAYQAPFYQLLDLAPAPCPVITTVPPTKVHTEPPATAENVAKIVHEWLQKKGYQDKGAK
jgi:hypothetical protein